MKSKSMPIYRHMAPTEYGVFRTDSPRHVQYAVVYAGHVGAQEEAERRVRVREGCCYGWARDVAEAEAMAQRAREEGCLNVIISGVERRVLPSKPRGIRHQNRPHEFLPGRHDRRRCESCGKVFGDGPHEP